MNMSQIFSSRIKIIVITLGLLTVSSCDSTTLTFNKKKITSLDVGTCFNDVNPSNRRTSTIATIDCSKLHHNEIYFTYQSKNLEEDTIKQCGAAFEKFIGTSYKNSEYEFDRIEPTSSSWQKGDRRVLCFAFHKSNKKIKDSLKGIVD